MELRYLYQGFRAQRLFRIVMGVEPNCSGMLRCSQPLSFPGLRRKTRFKRVCCTVHTSPRSSPAKVFTWGHGGHGRLGLGQAKATLAVLNYADHGPLSAPRDSLST